MPRKKTPIPDDLTGRRTRNWLVLGPAPDTLNTHWLCQCLTCGAETRVFPRSRLLGAGRLHGCTAGKAKPDPHKDAYEALGPALDC